MNRIRARFALLIAIVSLTAHDAFADPVKKKLRPQRKPNPAERNQCNRTSREAATADRSGVDCCRRFAAQYAKSPQPAGCRPQLSAATASPFVIRP